MAIRVLIADDDALLRKMIRRELGGEGDIELVGEADDGPELLQAIERADPDVVLLDSVMPGMDGEEITEQILDKHPDIRVLAWTTDDDSEMVVRMIHAGASGFILKQPETFRDIAPAIRRAVFGELVFGNQPRFFSQILRLQTESLEANAGLVFAREALESEVEQLADSNTSLEFAKEAIDAQLGELKLTYAATVEALADAVELRDDYTAGHIQRVKNYSLALAEIMDPSLTAEEFVYGYMLHDIGKLKIPDEVLLKPGKLTDEEFELIKTHTTVGARYVASVPFLRESIAVVRNHHERWDGRGYPDKLAAEEIPLIARIFALADTLDAITTDRPYRQALTLDYALEDFAKCAGGQFDPGVVDVFADVAQSHTAFETLREGIVPGRKPEPG